MDEKYVIQVIGKEDEACYIATVDTYMEADFHYSARSSGEGVTLSGYCEPWMLTASENYNRNDDSCESDFPREANNGVDLRAVHAAINGQISFNQFVSLLVLIFTNRFSSHLSLLDHN